MNVNKIAILGGTLIGAGALAYFFLRSSGSKESQSTSSSRAILSREVVLVVIKSLKKELFAVVMQISMMAQQMKQYSQGKLDYDIKDFIFSYPAINQEIQSSIDKAYRKHGVSEQDLQHSCETTFKDDKEIQTLMAGIRSMIDNAAEGKEIDMKTELPEFLTSETLLQIIEKIMRETTKQMQGVFKKIKDQYGELNLNDPRIAQQLQSLQADDIKSKIFEEYNLEDFDDPAQKIVSFATQKFVQESPEFQHKMMQLELKQRKSMEGIMQNPNSEGLVDKIFAEDVPVPGPAGGAFPGFHAQRRRQAPAQKNATQPAEEKIIPIAETSHLASDQVLTQKTENELLSAVEKSKAEEELKDLVVVDEKDKLSEEQQQQETTIEVQSKEEEIQVSPEVVLEQPVQVLQSDQEKLVDVDQSVEGLVESVEQVLDQNIKSNSAFVEAEPENQAE